MALGHQQESCDILCVFLLSADKRLYCRLLWRGLLSLCQLSSVLTGHLKVSNTLCPSCLVINSPFFPTVINKYKGLGKRKMITQLGVQYQFRRHGMALLKQSKRPCNSLYVTHSYVTINTA